jgi:AcrR family transcriptional regulator
VQNSSGKAASIDDMHNASQKPEGLRARKRRETLNRIAQVGLGLFLADGYEATTLEAVAAAAGISRRTFFHYFKSKEEILLAVQSGLGSVIAAALREEGPDQAPIDATYNAFLKVAAHFQSDEMIAIDRLMRVTPMLLARKQTVYVEHEQAVFEALCQKWPQPSRRAALRMVAMLSVGAMRLALDAWGADGGKRPLKKYVRDAFATLRAEV